MKQWHNKQLQSVEDRAGEYFYARFVWDVFPCIQGFHHSGPPRHLVVYNQSEGKYDIKILTKAERRIFTLNQGRSRSASPTERQRSAQPSDHSDHALNDEEELDVWDRGYTSKRRRLLSSHESRDSAVSDLRTLWDDSTHGQDRDSVFRHWCRSPSPDFSPTQTTSDIKLHRGRARRRS